MLFDNTARQVGSAARHIQERHVANCAKADPAYGAGVAKALGIDLKVREMEMTLEPDANAEGHDPSNLQQAKALTTQAQDRIACGILYQREDTPHFYDRLIPRQGVETSCVEEVRRYDVSEYWKELV
jgi:hypothetical protein